MVENIVGKEENAFSPFPIILSYFFFAQGFLTCDSIILWYMINFVNVFFFFPKQKAKQLIAKKEEGNKEFRSGKFEAAFTIYTQALQIDPNNKFTNSKLYCNRATVCSKVIFISLYR